MAFLFVHIICLKVQLISAIMIKNAEGGNKMNHEEILHSGMIYHPGEENLAKEQLRRLDMLFEYNALKPSQQSEKTALLKEMFAEIGENVYIETPFHSNFGGMNVHFGNTIYANFNLTLVDDTHIYVGSYTMFGPNVTVATASHPISPEHRKQDYQYNKPVRIGENCWIGAGVIILPGVTIGDNTVIGAGSVVTKDIPANVVAVGNPCRVLREINDDDRHLISHGRQMEIAEQ